MKYRWTMILHCTEKIIGLSKDVSLPIVIFLVVTVTWQGLQHIQCLTFEIEAKFFHKQRADVGGFRRVNWWHARSSLLQRCYALLELDRSRPVIRAFFFVVCVLLVVFFHVLKEFHHKIGRPLCLHHQAAVTFEFTAFVHSIQHLWGVPRESQQLRVFFPVLTLSFFFWTPKGVWVLDDQWFLESQHFFVGFWVFWMPDIFSNIWRDRLENWYSCYA